MNAQSVGQFLGYACCLVTAIMVVAAPFLVVYILKKRKGAPSAPTAGASGGAIRLESLGLALVAPAGAKVTEIAGDISVALPSGYAYRIRRGEVTPRIVERKKWIETHRTETRVLVDEPDAFLYTAKERNLPDVSFLAGTMVGSVAWYAETNGAIVEAQSEQVARLPPEEKARYEQAQRALQDLYAKKLQQPGGVAAMAAPSDEAKALTRTMVELLKMAPAKPPLLMSVDECRQGIALVKSMRAV